MSRVAYAGAVSAQVLSLMVALSGRVCRFVIIYFRPAWVPAACGIISLFFLLCG